MDPIIASVMPFTGNYEIRGWAFCDGRELPIAKYAAVFSIIGTTYGGNGTTTFALPDLRGRMPIGMGNANYNQSFTIGEQGGTTSVTLRSNQLPAHTHPASATIQVEVSGNPADSDDPANSFLTVQPSGIYASAGSPGSNLGGATATVNVGQNIGGLPFSNMPPYIAVNYLFALVGLFPQRVQN